MNWNWIFSLFQTWILQATAGRKIQFKLEKNPVHQTQYFELENWKNPVQIDKGNSFQRPWRMDTLSNIVKIDYKVNLLRSINLQTRDTMRCFQIRRN